MAKYRGTTQWPRAGRLCCVGVFLVASVACSHNSTGPQAANPVAPTPLPWQTYRGSMRALGEAVNQLDSRCVHDVVYEIPDLLIVIDGRRVTFAGTVSEVRTYRRGTPASCPVWVNSPPGAGGWDGALDGTSLTTTRGVADGCPLFVGELCGEEIAGTFSCSRLGAVYQYSGPFTARRDRASLGPSRVTPTSLTSR
jgi:hypothetical protein